MSIRLITAADSRYYAASQVLRQYAAAYGMRWKQYDLNGTSYDLERWEHKPHIINDALRSGCGPSIYMDADAFPTKPVGHIFTMSAWDVAATVRSANANTKGDNNFNNWTNAGVLAFRDNEKARKFVAAWVAHMGESGLDDQSALNDILHPSGRRPTPYSTHERQGAQVMFLPDSIYNHGGSLEGMGTQTKIWHLKSKRWENQLPLLRSWCGLIEPEIYDV